MAAVAQSQRTRWKSLLLAGLLAVCCNSVMAAGGTLKVIPHADLKNTDPIWTTAYITRNHGYMIYDTLFSLDANLQPAAADGGHLDRQRRRPALHVHPARQIAVARRRAGAGGGLCGVESGAGASATAWARSCWNSPKPSPSWTTAPLR